MEISQVTGTSSFSVFSVLSKTNDTLFKNPLVFFGAAVLMMLINFVTSLLAGQLGGVGNGVVAIVNIAVLLGIQAGAAYAVYQALQGKVTSPGDTMSRGFARLMPVLGIVLILTLGMIVLMIPLGLVGFLVARVARPLFYIFLLLAAILVMGLYCMVSVVVPACVVENIGSFDSVKRSMDLTKENRLKIFLLLFVVFVMYVVVGIISGVLGAIIPISLVTNLLKSVLSIFPQAFACVMTTIIYFELREAKEGTSLDSLAKVFE